MKAMQRLEREAAARKRVAELKQNPQKVRSNRVATVMEKFRDQMYGASLVLDLGGTKMPNMRPGTLSSDFEKIGNDFRKVGDDFRSVLNGEIKRLHK